MRLTSPWPRIFLGCVAYICGVRVKSGGRALKRDVFFVANHIGWIDIPIVAGVTGTAFVAQDGIASWPVIGWLASLNKTIFVSRTDRLGIEGQIAMIRNALMQRRPITIFPEGTTTDGRSLLPFKPSLFAAVAPVSKDMPSHAIMVQPIALDFDAVGQALAWVGEESAPANALRILRNKGVMRVVVVFLAPFDPTEHANRKAIAAEARVRIAASLGVQ